MYISMSHLEIPDEHAAALVDAFRDRAGLVDGADGFLDLEVWQSDRRTGELVMVSRWRDRESFTAYMRGADHRTSHGRIDPDLLAAVRLRYLDHLRTFEVVAR